MDLDAYNNGQAGNPSWGYGVYLDNASGGGIGNILLGTSRANWVNGLGGNFLSGLEVYTNGTVTLSNIRANDNGGDNTVDPIYGYGVKVDNSTSALPKAVILKGTNEFINDWNGGLFIESKGAITLNNITANDSGSGVYLDNTFSGTASPQNITLTGFGDFINNFFNGLEVHTYGMITLNNVNASDNGRSGTDGYGAYLDNYTGNTQIKAVTLNGYNSFSNNFTGGLEIRSLGAITLNNFNADNNTGFGAFLDNNDGSALNAITILGGAYTGGNGGYGLQVTSKGAITINVFDAWIGNNGSYGWNLDNHFPGAVGGITLSTVNPDWAFDFANNGGYGFLAQSLGSINVTGLDAYGSTGGNGATLNNAFPGSVGTITITTTGRNDFNGNSGSGLNVFSNRTITITNLYAELNGSAGVMLDNTSSGSGLPQNITINGSGEFYGNGDTGLVVVTYGLITLNNISANDNGQNAGAFGWGAYLDNYTGTVTPKGITLNGTNNFNGNYQDGLSAISLGAIKLNAVAADFERWRRCLLE